MKKLIITITTFIIFAGAVPTHAQFAVIDPANLAQNLLTAVRSLTQIENQVRQLQNEATMLINQARNLQGLDFNAANRLRATLAAIERLFDEAQGLAFEVTQLQTEFDRLYPRSLEGHSFHEMIGDRNEQLTQARDAWRTAMRVQARAYENFAEDTNVLSQLIDRSQSAVGILQATQAGNQLMALHIRGLMQAQQLQIAQDRAAAIEQARAVTAEARSHELRRQFMTRTTRYTPEPLRGF